MTVRHRQDSSAALDAVGEGLTERMATLLADHRHASGASVRRLARTTGGRYTARDLRRIEAGRMAMTTELAAELAVVYGLDLGTALLPRVPLEIRPFGVLSANGMARSFTPGDDTSLMMAYIDLIRALRGNDTTRLLELRRADLDLLAEQLAVPGDVVVERLAGLMGASLVQRRTLAGLFLSGALVISLSAAGTASDLIAANPASTTVAAPTAPTAAAQPTPMRMRSAPHRSPWSSLAMIDRAGHRQLLNPVFSWSAPQRSADAPQPEVPVHPEPAGPPDDGGGQRA
ncbi:MAG: hypothetical protein WD023_04025 [Ilumatobacteraceae bacterium]